MVASQPQSEQWPGYFAPNYPQGNNAQLLQSDYVDEYRRAASELQPIDAPCHSTNQLSAPASFSGFSAFCCLDYILFSFVWSQTFNCFHPQGHSMTPQGYSRDELQYAGGGSEPPMASHPPHSKSSSNKIGPNERLGYTAYAPTSKSMPLSGNGSAGGSAANESLYSPWSARCNAMASSLVRANNSGKCNSFAT